MVTVWQWVYNLPLPPPPYPLSPFSPSLISLVVSVDVKHHVYFPPHSLSAFFVCNIPNVNSSCYLILSALSDCTVILIKFSSLVVLNNGSFVCTCCTTQTAGLAYSRFQNLALLH